MWKLKVGYFVLGVLVTLLIGVVTSLFWIGKPYPYGIWMTESELLLLRASKNGYVIVIIHDDEKNTDWIGHQSNEKGGIWINGYATQQQADQSKEEVLKKLGWRVPQTSESGD